MQQICLWDVDSLGPDWFSSQHGLARFIDAGSRWPGSSHAWTLCLVHVLTQPGRTKQLIGCQTKTCTACFFLSLHGGPYLHACTPSATPWRNRNKISISGARMRGCICMCPARLGSFCSQPIKTPLHPVSLDGFDAGNQSLP